MSSILWMPFVPCHLSLELLNFSFVKQNLKVMRTFALSCVYMVTSWLFWFVMIKPTSNIPQFSLVGEN